MSKLCQDLNHLSRAEAQRLYDERLRQQSRPQSLDSNGQGGIEMQDSDWLDNLDPESWECMLGGPDYD